MPRKQDFSHSTIYHIRNKETKDVIYVGSSCNFTQRQICHKSNCNNKNISSHNQPIYVYIREHGDFECFEVIPISFHNFDNKVQLHIQEQTEIDKYPHVMNKHKAYITKEEKKTYQKEYCKEYRATHVEEKKAYNKAYRATHVEKLKEQMRAYRDTNTKEINEKKKEKIECPLCKRIVCRGSFYLHQKSKICMKLKPTPL